MMIMQNKKEHEDKRQYTFYLSKNLIDGVKAQCKDSGISTSNYLEKFIAELQGYQTPAVTIKNHIKIIDLYISSELEKAQVEFDKLAAEKVINEYRDMDKKEDMKQLYSAVSQQLTRCRNMKKSIEIIYDRLNYL